jgi:alkylhydroperoxidase/carboxymuconolactone decarboxylase family protein YurZ
MFDEINQIIKTRKKYNAQMFRSGISAFRELEDLEANALRDGDLTQKQKELIGLGIGISQGCYG